MQSDKKVITPTNKNDCNVESCVNRCNLYCGFIVQYMVLNV